MQADPFLLLTSCPSPRPLPKQSASVIGSAATRQPRSFPPAVVSFQLLQLLLHQVGFRRGLRELQRNRSVSPELPATQPPMPTTPAVAIPAIPAPSFYVAAVESSLPHAQRKLRSLHSTPPLHSLQYIPLLQSSSFPSFARPIMYVHEGSLQSRCVCAHKTKC